MAIREILEVPDPRLKVVSEPVTEFDDELKTLVEDMFETMYDAPGIGLAAIQVGVPKRVLVIDLQPEDPDAEPIECEHDGHKHTHPATKKEPRVFVNPVIVDPAEDLANLPGRAASRSPRSTPMSTAPRPAPCVTRTSKARAMKRDMEGLMATCIQHEMDHLEGILFIDHLSRPQAQYGAQKTEESFAKLRKLRVIGNAH